MKNNNYICHTISQNFWYTSAGVEISKKVLTGHKFTNVLKSVL